MSKLSRPVLWTGVALLGAGSLAWIALARGESINAVWLLTAAVCTYLVAYRFYARFIAGRVFALDANRRTPAERLDDGRDYVPTNRWIVFGHHFAAIAGPGPLVGPTLAAQFGYLPGALWIIVGVVLGGAVQDFVILCASVRRDGKSLGADGQGGDRARGRLHGARRRARHHGRAHRRARAGRRQRAQGQPVGHGDDRAHHSHRPAHGRVPAVGASRPRARGQRHRARAARRGAVRRPLGRRGPGAGRGVHAQRHDAGRDRDGLRLRGVGAAGVAPARAARLPVGVREDRRRR